MSLAPAEFAVLLKTDLMAFIEKSFQVLNPETEFSSSPHLEVMAAKLELCRQGKLRRLIVNLPPRSLKSHSVSVAFVAWVLGHNPAAQIISASYGQDLADKHARDCRTLLSSSFYQSLFPATRLSPEKQSVGEFITTKNGFRMSTSVGGVLTGRGADMIILDDPLKPDDAMSDTRRTAVNDWYDNTLLSRLNNKEKGVIIIVMQRLHQDDLVGHVLEKGGGWEVLSFPATALEDELIEYEDAFGRQVFQRKEGEALHPERESLQTLSVIRSTIGEYNFSSQYQQRPIPPGGAMVKLGWLKYYEPGEEPEFSYILQSWDTANKAGELNDHSVCTTWGVVGRKAFYLLDVYRKRLNFPDLKKAAKLLADHWNAAQILIEDKASGTQLIQELKREGIYQVRAYQPPPQTDKVVRLHLVTLCFEDGKVYLPRRAPWLDDYRSELITFPGSKYDDQVDSTTQALQFLANRKPTIYDAL